MQADATGTGIPEPIVEDRPWEMVDLTPVAPVAAIRRTAATLAAALVVVVTVVGAGLWPADSDAPLRQPATGTCLQSNVPPPVSDASEERAPSVSTAAELPQASTVVLMPADGEVVLGTSVAIAGRIHGRPGQSGEVAPSGLHVSIAIGDAAVGHGDFDVIEGRFLGSIVVAEQLRGRVAAMRFSDRSRPEQVLFVRNFVLGPRH